MLKKATEFTTLTFILIVCLLKCDHLTAQNNAVPSTLDSLRSAFSKSGVDTNGLKQLYDLNSGLIYENPDTAIAVGQLVMQSGLILVNKSNLSGNDAEKRFGINSIAIAYNNIGISYEFKAEYTTSLWYHNKSLKIRSKLGDTLGVGMSYNNIGNVYDSQGEYINALNYYLKAAQCFISVKNIMRLASSYNNIGIIYYRLGEQARALDYYFKALKLFAHVKNYSNVAQIYTNIAISYSELKDYNRSLEYNFKSLKIEQESKNEYNMAIVFTNIATNYLQLNKLEEAEENTKKALEINERLGLMYGVANNYGELGNINFELGNYSVAEKYLKRSLEIAEEIGALEVMKNQNYLLSQLYEKAGEFKKAFYCQKEFNRINVILFNSEKSKEMGRLEAVHEIRESERIQAEKEAFDQRVRLEKRRRKNLLQYSSIVVILLVVALSVTFMGVIKVKPAVASAVSFFAFLLLFEFLLLLFDPTIDKYSQGEPALKLGLNALVAVAIFPVHSLFDRMLRKRITRSEIKP